MPSNNVSSAGNQQERSHKLRGNKYINSVITGIAGYFVGDFIFDWIISPILIPIINEPPIIGAITVFATILILYYIARYKFNLRFQ